MQKNKIDLIIFNMSTYFDWDHGIQNRNFHILRNLQKNPQIGRILSIDFFPINQKQKLKYFLFNILPQYHKKILLKNKTSVCYQKEQDLFVYSSIKPTRKKQKITKEIISISRKLNLQKPIIWSYDPLSAQFLNLKDFSESSIIFDTVDNWIEHNSYKKDSFQKKLINNYEKIAQISSIIFTVSPNLNTWYRHSFNRKEGIYFIPNGIDKKYFTQKNIKNTQPIDFFEQPEIKQKKILGYIGTIQENRIDFELIEYIASKNKNAIIALCGPIWKGSRMIIKNLQKKYPHIYTPGIIPRERWLDYCNYFDIALNPHKVNDFTQYTSPTKIFEYLAAGKPVVSTAAEGTQDLEQHIYIAHNKKEFNEKIKQALLENTTQKAMQRNTIARQEFSWELRIDKMLDIITHHSSFHQ